MLAQLYSCGLLGIEGQMITVEADVTGGLPYYQTVGLPDTSIKESKDRISAAIKNSCYDFPVTRVTVNLAPADLKKEGASYDLPIALALLLATRQIADARHRLKDTAILGELSLSGDVKPVHGVLAMALEVRAAGFRRLIVAWENRTEASLVEGLEVIGVKSLSEACRYFEGVRDIAPAHCDIHARLSADTSRRHVDFADIKGQEGAKRALEIAAAGGHNVLMSGPPGTGKTLLAKAFPAILPKLTPEEVLEITKIYSVAGKLGGQSLITQRPFRSPHHTVSDVSLTGGGSVPKPGEVSLAHLGVLYLDELPEFHKSALEVLRQPIEDGAVTISRVKATLSYPASFTLIASMNPCKCGYYGDPNHTCSCTSAQVRAYNSRISGPLLDRMDMRIQVYATTFEELSHKKPGEASAAIAARVNAARAVQNARYKEIPGLYCNAQLSPAQVERWCALGEGEEAMMKKIYRKFDLNPRGYHRILKLARTIADLAGETDIQIRHLTEAVQYRTCTRV